MIDNEIAALERRFAETQDPDDLLRLARARNRAGRDERTEEFLEDTMSRDYCGCATEFPCDPELVQRVEAWEPSVPDEETGWALFELHDGRWGYYSESQDYTGHG